MLHHLPFIGGARQGPGRDRLATYQAAESGLAGRGLLPARSRVLLVEDDYLAAIEADEALTGAGFDVVGIAVSADEAARMARQESPDLVLMDVRLIGGRDGVDAAIEIFAATGIRAVFVSAHDDTTTRRRAEPANPLGWLSKPYTVASLVTIARQALGQLGRA